MENSPGMRRIATRTAGVQHGPICRLISPDGLGEKLKPFIFLDFFNADIKPGFGFGMHPHSGIATLTWQPGSDVRYRDTTGKNGVLKAGGLEWMNAGGGAWHQGELLGHGRVTGFQLWVPMPPEVEDGPAFGQYIPPDDVPRVAIPDGDVLVLLGDLGPNIAGGTSAIDAHHDLAYLVLTLRAGGRWTYAPPEPHTTAWAFAFEGAPTIQGHAFNDQLLSLDGPGSIAFAAGDTDAKMLIGTAAPFPHSLVLGPHSVHTNAKSLQAGLENIAALGRDLALPRRA